LHNSGTTLKFFPGAFESERSPLSKLTLVFHENERAASERDAKKNEESNSK
jgi:hypothetical protein